MTGSFSRLRGARLYSLGPRVRCCVHHEQETRERPSVTLLRMRTVGLMSWAESCVLSPSLLPCLVTCGVPLRTFDPLWFRDVIADPPPTAVPHLGHGQHYPEGRRGVQPDGPWHLQVAPPRRDGFLLRAVRWTPPPDRV